MGRLKKSALGIVAIFVLLLLIGAISETQEENTLKNAKTVPYTVVNFWSAHQPTAKRYSENILVSTTDHEQIKLIAKKEVLKLKENYGADVIWMNICTEVWEDNPKICKNEIARVTWIKDGVYPRPQIDPNAEDCGSFAGGKLYILWH